jgi:hypothetical protein
VIDMAQVAPVRTKIPTKIPQLAAAGSFPARAGEGRAVGLQPSTGARNRAGDHVVMTVWWWSWSAQ